MNRITVMGRLGKDPAASETAGGTQIVRFSVACERMAKDRDGNKITDWFDCVAWAEVAERCAKRLHKGDLVVIHGEMQQRKYTDRDGKEKTAWECRVLDVGVNVMNNGPSTGWVSEEEKPQMFPMDDNEDVPF